MLKEALMVVTMFSGSGNGAYGSETVTVTQSMEECRNALRLFQSTKGKARNVEHTQNGVKFTQVTGFGQYNRNYEATCTSFEELGGY